MPSMPITYHSGFLNAGGSLSKASLAFGAIVVSENFAMIVCNPAFLLNPAFTDTRFDDSPSRFGSLLANREGFSILVLLYLLKSILLLLNGRKCRG